MSGAESWHSFVFLVKKRVDSYCFFTYNLGKIYDHLFSKKESKNSFKSLSKVWLRIKECC